MDSDKIRFSIKEAARELFRRHGYQKTSVNGIAAGAHLAKATLYKYFDSKELILKEILIDYVRKNFDDLLLSIREEKVPPDYLAHIILKTSRFTYTACNEYMGWDFIRESANAQEFLKNLSDDLETMLLQEAVRIRGLDLESSWGKSVIFLISASKSIVFSFAFTSVTDSDVKKNFVTFRNNILPYLLKGALSPDTQKTE